MNILNIYSMPILFGIGFPLLMNNEENKNVFYINETNIQIRPSFTNYEKIFRLSIYGVITGTTLSFLFKNIN